MNDKQALRAFVEGLKGPSKLVIKASRFTKLKEAIANALEEEKTTAYYNNIHRSSVPSFSNRLNSNRVLQNYMIVFGSTKHISANDNKHYSRQKRMTAS
jgi:hypothetical protein